MNTTITSISIFITSVISTLLSLSTVTVSSSSVLSTHRHRLHQLQYHHHQCCPHTSSTRAYLHVVGMLRFMSDINKPSLPIPFHFVLVSLYLFMALSTVFNSTNSSNNSPFSHYVLSVLSLPYWSFQLYTSLWKSPSALI